MGRMRLKRRIFRYNKIKSFIVIFIFLIICLIFIFKYINLKVSPILLNIGEVEVKKFSSIIINNSVNKAISEDVNIDNLFLITKDNNNEIKTIDFNPITVNEILTNVTNNIQVNLKYIEQGKIDLLSFNVDELIDYDKNKLKEGIIYEIPSGVVFGNALLSNMGPKIPVKLSLVGDIISYVNTEVTSYGINNALIEINIILEVSARVILPFVTDEIKIETSIPVALKLIQGSIPNYYLGGINQNSNSLSLPIE